jgi:hypothetical protein
MDHFSWKRSPFIFLLMLSAIGLRLGLVFQLEVAPTGEREQLYTLLADEWKTNLSFSLEGHPTAVLMPLYPILLGITRWISADTWLPVLILQAILGGLTGWLVYRLAWRISRIETVAWLTLLLCLFYPPLMLLGLKLEPEILYGFLLALGMWLLSFVLNDTPHLLIFLLASLLFMGGIYLMPKVLILIPLVAIWAGIKAFDRVTGFLGAVALCLACVLCLMPWMARNFLSVGGFVPLTTGFLAPLQESLSEAGAPKEAERSQEKGKDESFQYHSALQSLFSQLGRTTPAHWGHIFMRGFPFWVTSYPGLLPGTGSGPPAGKGAKLESTLFYRAIWLSVTMVLFLLAVTGIIAACFNFSAWILIFILFLSTLVDILFNNPSYYHLAYWQFYAIFIAWGGWILFGWILKPVLRARPRSSPPALSEPLQPVQAGFGDLEPITTRHLPRIDKDEPKEDNRLGPIF